jgi:predicted permease
MDHLFRDVRYSVRMLLKAPGLTAVAVASLALGIGANTTIFTLINAMFLNPIQVERPSELVAVFTVDDAAFTQFGNLNPVSRPNFIDFREQADVLSDMAAYSFPNPVNLTTGGEPEQVFTELVTGNYFELLGVKPHQGRFFYPDEDVTPGTHPVVVMGHGLWQRRFGGDAGIVGREIQINGNALTVVGVAPEGFKGVNAIGGPELWVPSMMYAQVLPAQLQSYFDMRRALIFNAAGRLAPGRSVEEAAASVATIAARLEQEYPVPNKDRSATAVPLTEATIFPGIRGILVQGGVVLMVVVGLVLLIACSNVANLLLAKASSRRKEIAIRLALGAGRLPLMRQLLVESVLLAMLGGAFGLLVAYWGRDFIWAFRPPFLQQNALDLTLDVRVLGFTFAVSVATGLLFGLAPALQSSRPNVVEALNEEGRGNVGSGGRAVLRNSLVVAQVGLSLVALVAAGLFLRSLGSAQNLDPGFETEQLAVVTVSPGQQGYDPGRTEQFYRRLLEVSGTLPGVRHVSLASNLPLFGGFGRTVFVEGQPTQDEGGKGQLVTTNTVGVGYFAAAGISLKRGRAFDEADRPESRPVAVINEKMASQFWPNQEAVGKRFQFYGDDFYREVVGVVQNSNYVTIGEDPQAAAFVPLWQNPADTMTLYLNAGSDPATTLAAARREIQLLDPEMPMTNSWTVGEVIDQSLWVPKLGAALLAVLGLLALGLAAVGLYGVMAYWVAQRRREIGIRMALGARASEVLHLVLKQGMLLVGIGVGAGVALALVVSRGVSALLYGISPSDPLTFLVVVGLLTVVAILASGLPALRATRVDPLRALRIP